MVAESVKTRLLMIDDDVRLCQMTAKYLEPMGYEMSFAHSGQQGLEEAFIGGYDVVILDVMLPDMDGFEILKRLRSRSRIPILMLTARGGETDRIVGLEMGADDYLPKTFSARELLARLRAVARRSAVYASEAPPADAGRIEAGDLSIEPGPCQALMAGRVLELTPIEFKILHLLARNIGLVLSRDQILRHIASREHDDLDRAIDVHISSLRRKLGDKASQPTYIKTVRGFGYMFLGGPQ